LPERSFGSVHHRGIAKLRVIERIEKLRSELQRGVFPDASDPGYLD
jgi:hypothetical protein